MRMKKKAICISLHLIIDYVLTKQRNLDKLEDRLSIRNIIIMNMEEGYGDD